MATAIKWRNCIPILLDKIRILVSPYSPFLIPALETIQVGSGQHLYFLDW
jgi:hypothetical protein